MFEPTRGGTRGGQAEFKWSDVSADKDREHYLGHSINAPTGRWQKNKDVHWYSRDQDVAETERLEEIRKVKEAEAEALAAVLGYEPTKPKTDSDAPATSANQIPLTVNPERAAAQDKAAKEERRRKKAERKEEKAERKEEKRRRKEEKKLSRHHRRDHSEDEEYGRRRHRLRSRSRSPPARRSASPPRRRNPADSDHRGPDRRHDSSPERYSYRERDRDQRPPPGSRW